MMDKMPVPYFVFFFQYLIKSRLVNSEMFTASTNTVNFKFVGILGNGVCALRLVCLEDTDYLKNAKDGQECVYHSVHNYATIEYNNLKSLVIHSGVPKLGHMP